jgi:hypothetical protein
VCRLVGCACQARPGPPRPLASWREPSCLRPRAVTRPGVFSGLRGCVFWCSGPFTPESPTQVQTGSCAFPLFCRGQDPALGPVKRDHFRRVPDGAGRGQAGGAAPRQHSEQFQPHPQVRGLAWPQPAPRVDSGSNVERLSEQTFLSTRKSRSVVRG